MMTQQETLDTFLPLIDIKGEDYQKFTIVEARRATPGEVIITETSDGVETTNTAKGDDYVVRNSTGAQELYLLGGEKLHARYTRIHGSTYEVTKFPWEKPDLGTGVVQTWCHYQATGKCRAVKYNGREVQFMASWGEPMALKPGDMLCTPLPQKGEVYRIAAREFSETYRLAT